MLKTILNGIEIINENSTLKKIEKNENETKIKTFNELFDLIKQYKKKENPKILFQKILFNVLIGNQLVIRSNDISIANDILKLFMVNL